MRHKTIIILLSISIAFIFTTGGYGFWEKNLIIKTDIVVKNREKEKKEKVIQYPTVAPITASGGDQPSTTPATDLVEVPSGVEAAKAEVVDVIETSTAGNSASDSAAPAEAVSTEAESTESTTAEPQESKNNVSEAATEAADTNNAGE